MKTAIRKMKSTSYDQNQIKVIADLVCEDIEGLLEALGVEEYKLLDNMVITRGVRLYRKDGGNGGGIFYILLLIFLLSLVFLTSHERTKTTMFYVSCYSILASVLLSVVFVSSSYFVGDHTKNRGLYVDTLREIENTISQFDVSNIKEDAEAILNPESIEEEQKE